MITTTDITYQGVRHALLHITAEAEASEDESDVIKLDISTLPKRNGSPPTTVTLIKACWNTTFGFVRVEWSKSGSDETILLCSGEGERDFDFVGGKHDPGGDGTNDVIVTTDGGADGDVYDIALLFKLEF